MRWQSFFEPRRQPEKDVEQLVENIKSAMGERLKSVILFGSMVSGGFDPRRSNVNVLVVADLSFEDMERMAPALTPWLTKGHLPPVLVAPDDLDDFARDFPIEFLDMQDTHRVLHGEDLLRPLKVDMKHLEAQVEHDLALAQLRLRQAIAAAGGKEAVICKAVIASLPSVLTLLRAALRIEENHAKLDKIKATQRLAERLGLDVEALEKLQQLKVHRESDHLKDLSAKYLKIIDEVLRYLRKR